MRNSKYHQNSDSDDSDNEYDFDKIQIPNFEGYNLEEQELLLQAALENSRNNEKEKKIQKEIEIIEENIIVFRCDICEYVSIRLFIYLLFRILMF